MANGSGSSQNSRGDIRKAMVETDVVEVMLLDCSSTQIPACLWFLAKRRSPAPAKLLFIDSAS
jgi:type I restriction enzyme M protein